MKTRWFPLVVLAVGSFSLVAGAADWPQWRGPQRDGVSRERGLLHQWPEGGPKLLWQVKDIGYGYSTPAVVGERLYLLGNEGIDDEFVAALDVKDGKRAWFTRLGKVGPNQGPQYPGARSTPTVDGKRLYALGSDGDLACLETATGSPHWQKSLRSEFGGKPGVWAYSESPLIDGDVLVCTPGGAEATLVALDKQTGETIWKSAVADADQAAYASVIVVEAEGVKQYVQFLQKGVVGVDAKTGKFLWRYDATSKGSPANIPTPVAHEGQVYSGTGRGGAGLVKLRADNGQFTAEQVYFEKGLPTAIGGAVLLDGFLYGTNGQSLICAEFATGKVRWQDRCIGTGAVCYADGCLYIHGEKGDVALVEAKPDAYHELGRFTPPDQPDRGRSQAWAYPVVSGGRLFVRDLGTLWCYDVGEAK
ncbi:MAG TPA: PQQ-binding-like beta-propeller repeat protein [Pirellulales bacterium]|nr:PQQ-binding-like beta-propeller repeat protein [Pirellulales bacterium]